MDLKNCVSLKKNTVFNYKIMYLKQYQVFDARSS